MKKNIIVIAIALLAVASSANAQFLKFGIKGGLTSSNVKFDKTTFDQVSTTSGAKDFIVTQGDSKMGYQFGLFGRIKVLGIFIQPELLFSHSQGEVLIADITANEIYKETQKFNKVDIPVIVGWKIGPARLGIGPVASFMLGEKDGLKDKLSELADQTTTSNFNKATFGYQVGAGLDILGKITLDVRYEGNLSKLGNGIKLGDENYSFDQRNPQWIFSVGIFF
ncbi:MAG: PorT family protein [Bacteroidales bacterium]|nr:MAG: PorT family protein [Bacteroidales bacterium]